MDRTRRQTCRKPPLYQARKKSGIKNQRVKGLLKMRGLDARLLDGLGGHVRAIIRKGHGGWPGVLAHRQKVRRPRLALGARDDSSKYFHDITFGKQRLSVCRRTWLSRNDWVGPYDRMGHA